MLRQLKQAFAPKKNDPIGAELASAVLRNDDAANRLETTIKVLLERQHGRAIPGTFRG